MLNSNDIPQKFIIKILNGKNIQAEKVSGGRDYIACIFVLTNTINPVPTIGVFRSHGNATAHLPSTFPYNLREVFCSRAETWLAEVILFDFSVPHSHNTRSII